MGKNFPRAHNWALLTDLYELTMAASYFEHKRDGKAVFDLFIRDLPKVRSFFLAAGLEDVIEFLETFHFDHDSIKYLEGLGIFHRDFLEHLKTLRFTGDVWAIPEGTVFFPNEPIVRVVAPLIEAQIIESFLLNTINLETMIATKAARVVMAARGRSVFDFALRRTHGATAALRTARSSYIAGFKGTSNVLAGSLYGIPVAGTMAHSFVMSFKNEVDSFRAFAKTFPKYSTLLIDTYDTIHGVENAVIIAKELEKKGRRLVAVRLDSGDMARLAIRARFLLDKAGLSYVKIFASGNLDEYKIKQLLNQRAPIDSFGVGTKMGVSADAPYCDVIYKLSEVTDANGEFLPTMKLSRGKTTYPGRKQVYRITDKRGMFVKDVIALDGEEISGKSLLIKIIDQGKVIYDRPSLKGIRELAKNNLLRLPKKIFNLSPAASYPVDISPKLKGLTRRVTKNIQGRIKQ